MARPRHSKKDIEVAVAYAESMGWRFEKASARAHIWGTLLCPLAEREGCKFSVLSTPKSPRNHAEHIRRAVDRCQHSGES